MVSMLQFLLTVYSLHLFFSDALTDVVHKIKNYDYGSSYDPLGYNYPIPLPFDDPATSHSPSGIYLPPTNKPTINYPPFQDERPLTYLPPHMYLPPQIDPIPTDDTLFPYPPQNQYLPPPSPEVYRANNIPVQLKILNMSCLDTTPNRFFRAAVSTSQLVDVPPVIDNSQKDCVFGTGDTFTIDINGKQMSECGIRYCSGTEQLNLCLPIRLPTIRGLRLPEDNLVTLQCRPQDRVVSHVKHLRMNPQIIKGRSASMVAAGGQQKDFETQVSLFRRATGSNGEFTQIVTPGSAVHLGEELMLRAVVREGDGWNYSRLGSVTIQRIASSRSTSSISKSTRDSVTLVDMLGCRVPSMRSVCPEHPRQVNPLVTTFPLRAFMFQGADSGDEMILTVRMVGCLRQEDCFQARTCEEKVQRVRTRAKRETNTTNENTIDWHSYLEFKVVLPENPNARRIPDNEFLNSTHLFAGLSVIIVLSFVLVGFLLRKKLMSKP